MKKMVLVTAGLLSLFIIIMKSDAEMKITPIGVTSPDNSATLHLSGGLSTGDASHDPDGAVISGVNTYSGEFRTYGGSFETAGTNGRGVYGIATGTNGRGVQGSAIGTNGRGVQGYANGTDGVGVYGSADNDGDVTNFGGYFEAAGTNGKGVYGLATGTEGRGIYGYAPGTNGRGVYGEADRASGRGVSGIADWYGEAMNFGGYFRARGTEGRGVYGEASNSGNVTNYGGYFKAGGTDGKGVYGLATGDNGMGVYGLASDDGEVMNYGGYFKAGGTNGWGVYGYGKQWSFYADGPGGDYGPFTGAHEVIFAENMPGEIVPGMIVSVTGKTEARKDKNGEISLSSTLPTVTISTKAKDKAVFGVIVSDGPLPEEHWYETQEGERFGVVNALGEGRVWVTNFNGQIQAGDYITTSFVQGYGQLQDDDLLHSYTLGKAIETIEWDHVAETVQHDGKTYKRYLIAVVYSSG